MNDALKKNNNHDFRDNLHKISVNSLTIFKPGFFNNSRSSRISCESDITESQGSSSQEAAALGRSASTGMVNVDREAWQRVAEGMPFMYYVRCIIIDLY